MSQSAPPRADFGHIPVTFSSYLSEQLRGWETLFPAEQAYLERLSRYLGKAPASMFAPLEEIEKKMGVNQQKWPRGKFTLEQVDFLNRNANYQQWRAEIARLFGRIDPVLEEEVIAKGRPRAVIVLSPAELPVGPDRLWTRLEGQGRRVRLSVPEEPDHYLALLLGGDTDPGWGHLLCSAAKRAPYSVWAIETGEQLSAFCRGPGTVHLSYDLLSAYRLRLMAEVQKIAEDAEVKGPRQLSERLKGLKMRPEESSIAGDGVLSEFARTTLLAGNGTLLVNNTFVEWSAIQALRRARPEVLLVAFGIRNKLKPFSSLLIFHDQNKATAIPTQADMLGSYVDLEVFYEYVWREAAKHPEYRNNTAYVFAAIGMDELLLIAPQDFPLETAPDRRWSLSEVQQSIRTWLGG